jgi:rubrerythrin
MAKILYLSEIVKFAIEKEEQSYALYEKLHNKVTEAKAKDLFKNLMEQELQHKAFYSEMLSSIPEQQTPKVFEDDEYYAYMHELIAESRKIAPFTELDFANLAEVFNYAIGREEDSILFYTGLKNYVSEDIKNKIDVIIKEEARHLALLAGLKKSHHPE